MPAAPKEQGVVRKGKTIIRPTRCTLLPANSVIFPELLGLNLISFSMIFQGSWFVQYKSFPPPEERPRGFASSYKPSPQSFRENFCFSSYAQQGFLLYPVLQNRGSCCASWGFFRKRQLSVLQVLPLTFLVSFLTSESRFILTFSAIKEGGYMRKLSSVTRGKHSMAPLFWTVSEQNWGEILHSSAKEKEGFLSHLRALVELVQQCFREMPLPRLSQLSSIPGN